jgi:hypothetical protein
LIGKRRIFGSGGGGDNLHGAEYIDLAAYSFDDAISTMMCRRVAAGLLGSLFVGLMARGTDRAEAEFMYGKRSA